MAGSHRGPGLKDERRVTQRPQDNIASARDLFPEHGRGKARHHGRRRPSVRDHRSRSPLSSCLGPPSGREDIVRRPESSPRPSVSRRPSFEPSHSRPLSQDGPKPQEARDDLFEKSRGRSGAAWETVPQSRRGRSPRRSRPDRNRKNRNATQNRGWSYQQEEPSSRDNYQDRTSRNQPYPSGGVEHTPRGSPSPRRQDTASQRSFSPGFLQEDRKNRGQSPHSVASRFSKRSPSIPSNRESGNGLNHHISVTTESRTSPSTSRPTVEALNEYTGNNQVSESLQRHKKMNSAQDFDMRDAPTGPRADRQNSSQYGATKSPYPNDRGRGRQIGNDIQDSDHDFSNMPPSHTNTPQRGGYHRGDYQDRRFSGHGSGFNGSGSHRGRGHFNNSQWIPTGPRDRESQNNSPKFPSRSGSNTPQYQASQLNEQPFSDNHHDDSSGYKDARNTKELQAKSNADFEDAQTNMPPPAREPASSATPAKEGGKFSFAFKSKTNPPPAAKPVPDLAQRMQVREPPRGPAQRGPEPSSRGRMSGPLPPPKFKPDHRPDRRDRDRDSQRGRGRDDRRDFYSRNARDLRRDDHRFDPRGTPRRDDPRPDFRPDRERRRDRSPEPKRQKRLVQRVKPRRILPEEFRDSDSVYYRKPGDESVIGAGTYGKVFKAIHIYTEDKVALKRIRMEGEKDGFPVTAVREIKLLQHLRHKNVVSLLEVMVEKNECFMVFEYLSHDLTGLINHPTFTLTEAHKKDLAKQMFSGLQYLHHRGVLHRDIKAANILISNRGQLKYADFGLARFFSKSRQLDYTNRVITIWYRPPELLLGDTRYGPAVDVWSAACVFMEMFTKKAVFPGDGKELNQLDKLYSSLGTPTRAEWPGIVDMPWVELMGPTERKKRIFEDTYRDSLSPSALDLVCQIFQYDPAKRPTADEVLAHAYFTAEEPGPRQATELENIEGDWHEFESKALRKEKDREAREARKDREKEKEKEREKEKRRASAGPPQEAERDAKRQRQEGDNAHQQG